MVRFTGDLSPRASGSASLGVEMNDGVNKFTTDIRPYAHVHMNSGVIHDPANGQSGVLRFNSEQSVFEVSVDGGATFNFISVGAHTGGGGTLQDAYEDNNYIFATPNQNGPVNIAGIEVAAISLAANGGNPHIQMSGLIGLPDNVDQRGDFWIQNHTAAWEAQLTGESAPTTLAEADALSLGPAMPFYNTGSGVTNLMIASGINTFFNNEAVVFDQDSDAELNTGARQVATAKDLFHEQDANQGIRFNVAGAYRLDFEATIEKTDGNLLQSITMSPRVIDKSDTQFTFLGADQTTSVRDSENHSLSSMSSFTIGDFDVDETVYLLFTTPITPLPDFDKIRIPMNAAVLSITYIGPKRLGKLNRLGL